MSIEIQAPTSIQDVLFSQNVRQAIPFELITAQGLFARCAKSPFSIYTPHRIHFHSLVIVTQGQSTHMVDFQEYPLSTGTILPLTQGQVHAFRESTTLDGYVISFDESFITQNISEQNLFHFLQFYHTPILFIKPPGIASFRPILTLLEQLQVDPTSHLKSELAHSLFMALLLQVKRLTNKETTIHDSQRFKDFIRFKQLVTTNFAESHNAKTYAQMLSVSYNYLNDICKEMSNKTAKAFIDSWLLLEIKRSIIENKYTYQEIAYRMGFNEPSNFIRFFKKHTGSTPSKFAENMATPLPR